LIPQKVANPTKPFGVARTLFKNKEKLIEFLENFEVRFEFSFSQVQLWLWPLSCEKRIRYMAAVSDNLAAAI